MNGLAIRKKDLDDKPRRLGISACVPAVRTPPGSSAAVNFNVDFMTTHSALRIIFGANIIPCFSLKDVQYLIAFLGYSQALAQALQ
jgi:hypothetical protein